MDWEVEVEEVVVTLSDLSATLVVELAAWDDEMDPVLVPTVVSSTTRDCVDTCVEVEVNEDT